MKIAKFRCHTIQRTCVKSYKTVKSYKPHLQRDFSNRCCYCNLCEDTLGLIPFEVDHFIPRHEFIGKRNELDTCYRNLVLACPKCNRAKSDQFEGDVYAQQIENELFYNPDEVDYNQIFYRDELGRIASDDPKGQRMIAQLQLYRTIHSYAWLLERLARLIDRLDERTKQEKGEGKKDLENIRYRMLDERYKIEQQFIAAYR